MKFKKRALGPILLLALGLAISIPLALELRKNRSVSYYNAGINILRTDIKSALDYFQVLAETGDETAISGFAWAQFRAGKYEIANGLADLLITESANIRIKARSLYLKGSIAAQEHKTKRSVAFFNQAKNAYGQIDNRSGVYRSNISMATLLMLSGDNLLAGEIVENLKIPNGENPGSYFRIKATLAFRRSSYVEAAELNDKAISSFTDNQNLLALFQTLTDRAFQLAWLGNVQSATEFMRMANDLNVESKKESAYQKIVQILCKIKKNEPYKSLIEEVQIYSDETGDMAIMISLNSVINSN